MGQPLAELGSGGEVGRQLLVEAHGLVVVLLRLLEPARVTQQTAAVEVAAGQILAELGTGGEVGRQLLVDAHGLVVVLLRLRKPARRIQKIAAVEVAASQILVELRSGGEVRPPVASGCSRPGRSPAPPPSAGRCPAAEGRGCCG